MIDDIRALILIQKELAQAEATGKLRFKNRQNQYRYYMHAQQYANNIRAQKIKLNRTKQK